MRLFKLITALCTLSIIINMLIWENATAYNRQVLIINNTSHNIIEFYGSNTGTTDWQEDILGVDLLEPGKEVQINFDDATGYCMFDFLVVFDDGSKSVQEKFNVCDLSTLTITE